MRLPFGKSTLLLLAIVLIAGIAIESQTNFVRKTLSELIYDNRGHYLSCEELPALSEAERVVAEHQGLVQTIEQVNPGFIFFSVNSPCPGKGEIIIEFASHQERLQIEELIGGETFFGIPYRLINT